MLSRILTHLLKTYMHMCLNHFVSKYFNVFISKNVCCRSIHFNELQMKVFYYYTLYIKRKVFIYVCKKIKIHLPEDRGMSRWYKVYVSCKINSSQIYILASENLFLQFFIPSSSTPFLKNKHK